MASVSLSYNNTRVLMRFVCDLFLDCSVICFYRGISFVSMKSNFRNHVYGLHSNGYKLNASFFLQILIECYHNFVAVERQRNG